MTNTKLMFWAFLICANLTYGQKPHQGVNETNMATIKQIFNELKTIDSEAYKYSMTLEYPNDQVERIDGEVYINNEEKIFFNQSNEFTIIYDTKWLYKANHKAKSIKIVDLTNYKNKQEKTALR